MRILQISDLHLWADPAGRLKDIPTRETLTDVLTHIDAHERDVDYFIVTGDLTHDEQLETYQAVRSLLGDKVQRCRILPGNHDERSLIREVFADVVGNAADTLQFSMPAENWQLIGLDSHVPGEVPGRFDSRQVEWLRRELEQHADAPTALFMHHPPISVGVPWMDRIGLQEPEEFCALIESSPQVKFIACGHVHHEFSGRLAEAAVFTTPSTGVQFVPAGDTPDYDAVAPGYRTFEIDGDAFQTAVVRLPEVKYVPVAD